MVTLDNYYASSTDLLNPTMEGLRLLLTPYATSLIRRRPPSEAPSRRRALTAMNGHTNRPRILVGDILLGISAPVNTTSLRGVNINLFGSQGAETWKTHDSSSRGVLDGIRHRTKKGVDVLEAGAGAMMPRSRVLDFPQRK